MRRKLINITDKNKIPKFWNTKYQNEKIGKYMSIKLSHIIEVITN